MLHSVFDQKKLPETTLDEFDTMTMEDQMKHVNKLMLQIEDIETKK